jgi:fructoselysine-6-P-deglycase FrlB-like protein
MTTTAAEIATQPECWTQAAAAAADNAAALPRRHERVAVVGCGTSYFMALSFAALREANGDGETDAFAASEFPPGRRYDRIVALSRSGTTTEILRLLGSLDPAVPTVAVTADRAAPLAALAGAAIVLDFADERSVVQTRFATSALALWRAHLGTDLDPLAAATREDLAAEIPAQWVGRARYTFLGSGWGVGIAHEAALKLREAAQVWTESYPAMEFRHGPIATVDADSLVWIFGPTPHGLDAELESTGCVLVRPAADPMVALTGAQRLAVALAQAKGLDPDRPRNLTRSIVLQES